MFIILSFIWGSNTVHLKKFWWGGDQLRDRSRSSFVFRYPRALGGPLLSTGDRSGQQAGRFRTCPNLFLCLWGRKVVLHHRTLVQDQSRHRTRFLDLFQSMMLPPPCPTVRSGLGSVYFCLIGPSVRSEGSSWFWWLNVWTSSFSLWVVS